MTPLGIRGKREHEHQAEVLDAADHQAVTGNKVSSLAAHRAHLTIDDSHDVHELSAFAHRSAIATACQSSHIESTNNRMSSRVPTGKTQDTQP